MAHHIVIDGNAFYEVDEECLRRSQDRGTSAIPKENRFCGSGRCRQYQRNPQAGREKERQGRRKPGF